MSTQPHPIVTHPIVNRALDLAAQVSSRSRSAFDVVGETLARIDSANATLNCFSEVYREQAYAAARAVDAAIAAGRNPGPLAGVPVAVKNLFDVAGHVTLAGSRLLADQAPAQADAFIIERLRRAGAIVVGALHMDEFAYGFTTENSHYGAVRNPHDPSLVAGGSSGGSGAAVGGGLVPIALGTDTNGSIRVPAALCGIWGLKPTFGRLSRSGCFPFVASLDHVGPLADSVSDLALAYDLMQGWDAQDPACAARETEAVSPLLAALDPAAHLHGLRIGIAADYFQDHVEPEAWQAVERAAALVGATIEIVLPQASAARAAAFLMTAYEGGKLHWPNLTLRAQEFEPLSRDRLLAGALSPERWYLQAQEFRRWYRAQVDAVFQRVDVILAPSTPRSATPIGATAMTVAGQQMMPRAHMGMLTQPISFIGLPVVAAPFHIPGKMPLGVQIIAPQWREDRCLRVARALELASADFRAKPRQPEAGARLTL
jgi:AtzE family amidohydrolase